MLKYEYAHVHTREIIVRDDLKYPDGAVVVDGPDTRGRLLVHPLGGGLQFALPLREIRRFQSVEPAEQIPVFNAGTFYLEGIEGEFEGWSDGSSWNGWEKPCFTREVAERILEASGYRWSYDAATDEFTVVTSEEDEPELFSGQAIQLGDGGSVTAYFVGAGSWIWNKTEPSQGSGRLHHWVQPEGGYSATQRASKYDENIHHQKSRQAGLP